MLGLIAIVVIALLLVAYFQKHNIHIPGFGSTPATTPHKGGLAPLPAYVGRLPELGRSAQ